MSAVTAPTAPAERTLADRFIAVVPLLSVFLWLCIFYAVEAWKHGTPWLFGDELELTQLSARSPTRDTRRGAASRTRSTRSGRM